MHDFFSNIVFLIITESVRLFSKLLHSRKHQVFLFVARSQGKHCWHDVLLCIDRYYHWRFRLGLQSNGKITVKCFSNCKITVKCSMTENAVNSLFLYRQYKK